MNNSAMHLEDELPLSEIRQLALPTVADRVFDELQQRILSLELPPRTKISETDVARKMGVSRQPVREAFKRLAKQGFLLIRPQVSTTVSLISHEAVLRAQFVRTALEVHTCRAACEKRTDAGLKVLAAMIDDQKAAILAQDRNLFHALDDKFHHEICVLSEVDYVWDLVQESKGHMDRICMLSLDTTSQEFALEEHIDIFNAISKSDADAAAHAMSKHLSRILELFEDIKGENQSYFSDRI